MVGLQDEKSGGFIFKNTAKIVKDLRSFPVVFNNGLTPTAQTILSRLVSAGIRRKNEEWASLCRGTLECWPFFTPLHELFLSGYSGQYEVYSVDDQLIQTSRFPRRTLQGQYRKISLWHLTIEKSFLLQAWRTIVLSIKATMERTIQTIQVLSNHKMFVTI